MAPTGLVAVTFDFWDTLVRAPSAVAARASRHARLLPLLASLGCPVAPDDLDHHLAEARRRYDEGWVANRPYSSDDAIDALLAALEVDVDDEDRRRVLAAFTGSESGDLPPLNANIAGVLDALGAAGLRIGIICDVGLVPSPVLRSYLERHGILDRFDHWSFSDEVGVFKPDAKIFAHALDGLGVTDPSTAAHVGDLRRTDVAGARAAGMVSVRYSGSNDDPTEVVVPDEGDRAALGLSSLEPGDRVEAHHVITDHRQLLEVLGIG
jgi:FMN phosphatase YigB (HAD superfamily)